MPFSVTSNGSTMGVDAGSQYPNVIGDPYQGQTKYQWINKAAFARPQDGEYGNFHRNALRLPGVRNVDASLLKNFAITERMKVTFRAEFFNLLNNAQIWDIDKDFKADNPGGLLSTGTQKLGQPAAYREARIIQLALRFAF
jgi:hypothetical protein